MKKRDVIFTALGILLLFFSAFLVSGPKLKRYAESVSCGNYMLSICVAATMWADDNDRRMPTDFLSMSNTLDTPQILICPGDHTRQVATNWASFTMADASYKIIAPAIVESETNVAYLQCTIHTNHLGYVYGYVFDGRRMRTKSFF
ncbi:MAG TPA: hypothetical protein VJT54_07455 [Verrucomicrobiae bacterium]|nr:hypothetical protein [Verrucomicrobiae bacterium]